MWIYKRRSSHSLNHLVFGDQQVSSMFGSKKVRRSMMALVGLYICVFSDAAASSEEEVSYGTTVPTAEIRCTEPSTVLQIPFRSCFMGQSEASKLMNQMETVVGILNNDRDYADSRLEKLKKMPEVQEYETCSEKRIQQLSEEFRWVSRRLWELSIRLEEPGEAEVDLLDKRKMDLIRHLHNIRVYPGTQPSTMQLESFSIQVEYLDYGLNTALTMFQTNRTLRPTLPPARFAQNAIIQSILDPSRSTTDLIEMSRDQPTAMSEALPQLVSNWYAGKLRNFQLLHDLIKQLPKLVHQMIGYASLYDAMSANSDLESYELTVLVFQLQGINASVTSAAADIPHSVLTRYAQLVEHVWPVYQIVGRNASCDYRNLKYDRSVNAGGYILHLNSGEDRSPWATLEVPGTPMFTIPSSQWYSSANDVFSASKRSAKYRNPHVPELFGQWKLVPVQGGKYFKILNAKYDEVLFADKSEMNTTSGFTNYRRLFLARHDYPHVHDYEENADLWKIDCK